MAFPLDPDLHERTLRKGIGMRLLPLLLLLLGCLHWIMYLAGAPDTILPVWVFGTFQFAVAGFFLLMPRLSAWELRRKSPQRRPQVRVRFDRDGADVLVSTPRARYEYHCHWGQYGLLVEGDAFFLMPRRGRFWRPGFAVPTTAVPPGTDLRRFHAVSAA